MANYDTQIVRSNRRSLALHILPDATLLVKAPQYASTHVIKDFIEQHREWIRKRIEKIQERPQVHKRTYTNGDVFFYLGKVYKLQLGNYPSIMFHEDKLLFPGFLKFRIKKELETWYIQKAREIITKQLEFFSQEMDLSYTSISFADTKSRWGACTHDNQLQFNWRLVMAPLLVINYVIIHELAHTVEKNHSAAFWRKVRAHNPSYRQNRLWLKNNGDSLIV